MLLIWERYFLKELVKMFLLFLGIFYALYMLVDYSSHMGSVSHHHSKLDIQEFFLHYSSEFVVRAEILVPFALLIAFIKIFCELNIQNELVALLAAGYSKKRLLAPAISFALLITLSLYFNTEFLLPKASKKLQHLNERYVHKKRHIKPIVRHVLLEDGTTLLFRFWNESLKKFEEALWVRSIDEIWHIKKLNPYTSPPTGEFIDILTRTKEGLLALSNSYPLKEIDNMRFNKKRLLETITPPHELALSALSKKLPGLNSLTSEKEARILTAFYRKMALPWLALLAVLAVAPSCLRFSRQFSVFFIYAAAIFGLLSLYLIMDAATVLGDRQVLTPLIAIFAPFTFFSFLFIFRFLRT